MGRFIWLRIFPLQYVLAVVKKASAEKQLSGFESCYMARQNPSNQFLWMCFPINLNRRLLEHGRASRQDLVILVNFE